MSVGQAVRKETAESASHNGLRTETGTCGLWMGHSTEQGIRWHRTSVCTSGPARQGCASDLAASSTVRRQRKADRIVGVCDTGVGQVVGGMFIFRYGPRAESETRRDACPITIDLGSTLARCEFEGCGLKKWRLGDDLIRQRARNYNVAS